VRVDAGLGEKRPIRSVRESRWGRHFRYQLAAEHRVQPELSFKTNRSVAALDERRDLDEWQ
jgi:hypothetical protein